MPILDTLRAVKINVSEQPGRLPFQLLMKLRVMRAETNFAL
jgi:hypothetical protein